MAVIAGVVLAGGRSTRFGSEKAVARIGPAPLVAHTAEVLANGCGAVAVNASPASRAAAWAQGCGLAVVPDREGTPDGAAQGPLAGVRAALEWGAGLGAELVAVAPCDCPALPRDLVARLVAGLAPGAGAAAARTPQGPEPACAVWRTSARPAVEAALEDGAQPSLREALASVGASEVAFEDATAFADADTLKQLKALGGRPAGGWLRPTAMGALRLAAAVLLGAYALGGLVLVVLATASAGPRGEEIASQAAPFRVPAFDAVVVEGVVWLALVVWAAPRLVAPRPPRPPPPIRTGREPKLTRPPTRRI